MNPPPPEFPGGGHRQSPPPPSPQRREVQLQGPRPAPLKVSKDSHKIRKPPPHPPPRAQPPGPADAGGDILRQQPMIIYDISPKVIQASVSDFMSIVQRLTGPSTAAAAAAAAASPSGALSPAARLAAIEKTSPPTERERLGASDLEGLVGEGIEVGQFPGILSPAPATLAPIPAGFFSPASDPQTLSFLHDLSPFWAHNSFMASPSSSSALFSAPLVSPSPSSMDIFNLFDF